MYTQTAKKSVITDHGKYVKYKTKFNFAIFLILPDYRRVHNTGGMAFNLNYTKSGSVSEFYFFFTIVADLWR